ncbi:MAG: glycoside hydrolase [Candidatus Eremiobacter antarcticus]|nr:glycoside hydrolase family 1 protein [Candidatus Eremiobacteraeota bacterium]MBC5808860.1 glycoside hydrolase family 1 protein [Candidatus Eremiobacteraeota bacterium]PZR60453.1 MAG: glycoside hydrolase [Candidatus Eremiobacter sp. RRmetagenome_bin22]
MDSRLEIWGGIECTVNRVGDTFYDQLERNGHARRLGDLDLIAQLGIRTLRYPLLWERIAPNGIRKADWSWPDERLNRLRELGIEPIVGLMHHGSGPAYTSLLDDHLPHKLAEFADAVARRYPWLRFFTPVNEPLTTARFSALYGLWYPHERSDEAFLRALLNECAAVRLAMAAIRESIPEAKLVQTEDVGKTHSTDRMRYQANFDNARRWLTFDLLTGRIGENPLMLNYLGAHGFTAQLDDFCAAPCPPDLIGLNYYVTSERFLDERIERHPEAAHGGNAFERYADVAAVRACDDAPLGVAHCAAEVWQRYRLPLVITEVHLGCTPEEQLRWLSDIHEAARQVRGSGADLRAITAWSLFGSFDWNSLLTRDLGIYEAGAFDVRCDPPRPTALASAIRRLATNRGCDHPVLDSPGWWRRVLRFEANPHILGLPRGASVVRRRRPRPVAILGCPPALTSRVRAICHIRGITCVFARAAIWRKLAARVRPWAVLDFTRRGARDDVRAACVNASTRYASVADDADEKIHEVINAALDCLVHGEQLQLASS